MSNRTLLISLKASEAALLLLVSACGSNNDAHLIDSADFIMEENPDSALTLLDQVNVANFNHEYSARYVGWAYCAVLH